MVASESEFDHSQGVSWVREISLHAESYPVSNISPKGTLKWRAMSWMESLEVNLCVVNTVCVRLTHQKHAKQLAIHATSMGGGL